MTPPLQPTKLEIASSSATYPPKKHVLRDVVHWLESDTDTFRAGVRVVPELCAPAGGVRAAVWVTLVDVASGAAALQAVHPAPIATSDINLHTFSAVTDGEICARARVLREGRQAVVMEVDLLHDANTAQPVGLATAGFSALKSRDGSQGTKGAEPPARIEFGASERPLPEDIVGRTGLRVLDAAAGRVSLQLNAYCYNSLGAAQGGVLALMAEVAGESMVHAAGHEDWMTREITLHYLALGKAGPLETHSRLLHQDHEATLIRIEIVDRGNHGRRVLVATSRVGRITASRPPSA